MSQKMVKKNKILLFKNILNSSENSGGQGLSLATLYLASSLKKAGFEVILSSSQISLGKGDFITRKEELIKILKENPEINFIGLSLCEAFFEKAQILIKFLRKRTKAFIGVGGSMPTLTPKHVLTHLPEINFLIRGNGEEIFPRLVKILNGRNIDSPLINKTKKELSELKGFLFKKDESLIYSKLEQINHLKNTADLIDFSFFKKEDFNDSLFLFSSSGCFNNCFFCSSPYKGKFFSISFKNLIGILKKYYLYLKKVFKDDIPSSALRMAFLDDDFFANPKRAIKFFNYLKETPFKINFIQTGINAFYKRSKGKYTNELNQKLLEVLSCDLFDPDKEIDIYIGLENLSDQELQRLGKGYDFAKAKKIIDILSKKRIRVAYHFIASNQLTTLDNLFENLVKFSNFQILYKNYFNILTPIIPYLVSLYPSVSYKAIVSNKQKKFLNIRKYLLAKGKPEYNYPLIENDIPIDREVRKFVPIIYDLFLAKKDYLEILNQSLSNLSLLKEKVSKKKKQEISQIIGKYKNDRKF